MSTTSSSIWTKPYGDTGKDVSVIGFGGMRFANPKDIDASAELVLHAHQKGINYFDTAPGYCNDLSEDIFGAAIRQLPRKSFYISTKCGKADGAMVRESIERSLKRLGVEAIDFFHIWCVCKLSEWKQRVDGGAVAAALQAKEEGLVNHIVISSHLPGDKINVCLDEAPFEGVTLGYNAINFPYRQAALDHCSQRNLGVVTMNPLGGGLIPQNAQRFRFLCDQPGESVVQAALQFNVSQPAVTSALVGFSNKQEIDQAVAAVSNFQPYDHIRRKKIEQHILDSFSDDLCTGCGYCLPCPEGVEIPKLMDAYNMRLLLGEASNNILRRLTWHWNIKAEAAKACSQCGLCETRCTQHLPIRDRLKEIAALSHLPEPPLTEE